MLSRDNAARSLLYLGSSNECCEGWLGFRAAQVRRLVADGR